MLTKDLLSQLTRSQRELFVFIYNQCVDNHLVTMSNQQISEANNDMPISTVEKHLKLYDDLGLIVRDNQRTPDVLTGHWKTTSRVIKLNPKKFDPQVIAAIRNDRVKRLVDSFENLDILGETLARMRHHGGSNA